MYEICGSYCIPAKVYYIPYGQSSLDIVIFLVLSAFIHSMQQPLDVVLSYYRKGYMKLEVLLSWFMRVLIKSRIQFN